MKSIAIVYAFLLFCFGAIYLHYSAAHTSSVPDVPRQGHTPGGVAPLSSKLVTPNDTGVIDL